VKTMRSYSLGLTALTAMLLSSVSALAQPGSGVSPLQAPTPAARVVGSGETVDIQLGGGLRDSGVPLPAASGPGQGGNTGNVTVVVVKPGQNGTCGAKCANNANSESSAVLKTDSANTGGGFRGTISEVKPDYTVELGGDNTATVEGTGGTVLLGSGGITTVRNKSGNASILVRYPGGGGSAQVGPGSTCVFYS
jgi:hypothetical protein